MRGQLLFLCLVRLRAGSWQLLQGCLSPLLLATVWVPYQVQVHWERYLGLAPLLCAASGLGLVTSGVIAIHQRSICQAGTGSPVLGPSVLLCARCVLCTVLRVGTRGWERVCDQQRRHIGQLQRKGDLARGATCVEFVNLLQLLGGASCFSHRRSDPQTISRSLHFVSLLVVVLIGDCKERELPGWCRIQWPSA